jgi:hypothetical protein
MFCLFVEAKNVLPLRLLFSSLRGRQPEATEAQRSSTELIQNYYFFYKYSIPYRIFLFVFYSLLIILIIQIKVPTIFSGLHSVRNEPLGRKRHLFVHHVRVTANDLKNRRCSARSLCLR